MRVGHQRWQLVSSPQALWALQQRQRSEPRQQITGTWLGFKPSAPQRRWLICGAMLLNGCNRPWGRGGAVSLLLWYWACCLGCWGQGPVAAAGR